MRKSDRYRTIGIKRQPAPPILSNFTMHHQKSHSALRSAAKYRMMSTGDAGGGAEIEYPRGSHHDVYR